MEESHQEATAKEVERILGLLQTHFRNDRKYDSASMALIWEYEYFSTVKSC